jgi:hypothetical protein
MARKADGAEVPVMEMMGKKARLMDKNERVMGLRMKIDGKAAELGNEPSLASCLAAVQAMGTMKDHIATLSPGSAQDLVKSINSSSNNDHRRAVMSKSMFSQQYMTLSILENKVKAAKEFLEIATELSYVASYVGDSSGMNWSALSDDLLKRVSGA